VEGGKTQAVNHRIVIQRLAFISIKNVNY